ncbi:MAG: hypothetical protein WAN36_10250 [Calditrichia bacterium]
MSEYEIKNFDEIDYVNINPAEDRFRLPDGSVYRFSDHQCDDCWTGGTVLESLDEPREYRCVMCKNNLEWREFRNDFLAPTGDTLKFLLPRNWSGEENEKWFQTYKERRLAQEEFREQMLKNKGE